MDTTRWRQTTRIADRCAIFIVFTWVCYAALGKNLLAGKPWPAGLIDYPILYDFSKYIVARHTYPVKHAYPPSAIVLHDALAQMPFPMSAALYMGLIIGAVFVCWWLLARLLELNRRPGGWALSSLAFLPASHAFGWDLRSQNCNGLFLTMLLLAATFLIRRQPKRAGFWLALSISLKLFSILLIPYAWWTGRRGAWRWTLAFLVLFWLVLPVWVFGYPGVVEVYRSWLGQMQGASARKADLQHPILISIYNSAYYLALHYRVPDGWTIGAVRAAWLGLAFLALAMSWRCGSASADTFRMLAEMSLLVLAPIAVSPYLEPYHTTPLLIPAMLLLQAASDPGQRTGLRVLAGVCFGLACATRLVAIPWPLDGLMVNLQLWLLIAGALIVAWLRRPSPITISPNEVDGEAALGNYRPYRPMSCPSPST